MSNIVYMPVPASLLLGTTTMSTRGQNPPPPPYSEIELDPVRPPQLGPNNEQQQEQQLLIPTPTPATAVTAAAAEPNASLAVSAVPKIFDVPRPAFRTRLSWRWNKFLVGLPLGFIVFALVFSGSVYGIHYAIQHSGPEPNPARWMGEARTLVYEPCYLGCANIKCDDPGYAWDACAKSAGVHVRDEQSGGRLISCKATSMWNWPEEDRYPSACLEAVGEKLRMEEVREAIQHNKKHYGWIVLAFFISCICCSIGIRCHQCLTGGCSVRLEQLKPEMDPWLRAKKAAVTTKRNSRTPANPPQPAQKPAGAATSTNPTSTATTTPTAPTQPPRTAMRSIAPRSTTGPSTSAVAVTMLTMANAVQAYACVRPSSAPEHRVHFTNTNPYTNVTIAGVVHSWLANCGKGWDCSSGDLFLGCSSREIYLKRPVDFINAVVPRIEDCGFTVAKGTEAWQLGHFANQKLIHPGIEKKWWVEIKVTGFNVTKPNETEASVRCLYDIGGSLDV